MEGVEKARQEASSRPRTPLPTALAAQSRAAEERTSDAERLRVETAHATATRIANRHGVAARWHG
jgi:hypothetical protein